MSRLTYKPLGSGYTVAMPDSEQVFGMVDRDVDGFFYWFPDTDKTGASWSSWVLRDIVEKLEELNLPWQNQIDNDPALCEREP